jgi:hypothetical protein
LTGENGGRSAPGTVAVRGERERVRGRREFLRERGEEKELSEKKRERERTIKKRNKIALPDVQYSVSEYCSIRYYF